MYCLLGEASSWPGLVGEGGRIKCWWDNPDAAQGGKGVLRTLYSDGLAMRDGCTMLNGSRAIPPRQNKTGTETIMTKYTITIGKTGDSHEIDWDALPARSKEYLRLYGLKQTLNDCITSVKKADFDDEADFLAEARKGVDSRLSQILEGHPPAMGTRVTDPVQKRMRQIATDFVSKQLPKAKGAERRQAIADVMSENEAALRATAAKQLADEKGMTIALPKGLAKK